MADTALLRRYAADLRWVIESPSLVRADGRSDVADPVWPQTDAVDPQALCDFLESRSTRRVGYYFENLLHFWLQKVQGAEVLEHGRQIVEDGVTRGEIDFLYRNAAQQVIHLEVAVKFYLKTPETKDDGSHLIGPDPADNFATKHSRLFGHQLSLSQRLSTRVHHRQGMMKGRIFYHPNDAAQAADCPHINPAHLRGVWVRQHETERLAHAGRRYCILPKPFWLGEISTSEGTLSFRQLEEELRSHFAGKGHPVLLAALQRDEDGAYRECQRAFVVPTHWPKARQ